MKKEFFNPRELPDWGQAFSQVVVVTAGSTRSVYASGQVSVDRDKRLVGPGDLRAQADQAFRNLETALASAGAQPKDVVKVGIYVKDYKPGYAPVIREAFARVFSHENLPASTWLGVQALAEEGFLIEVDAIAVVPG